MVKLEEKSWMQKEVNAKRKTDGVEGFNWIAAEGEANWRMIPYCDEFISSLKKG